ncbi:glutamate ABC transporter substrate-binding protein [Nocardioides mesophilus]|uniref:Glutamate ABC transporter substrate-binding protein n=1 Tax=Nocardioides mesophilus TaxID=433659 RepID=A0A7G9R9I3_9ACTN|nr:glutamate ABC transporter substrate-binding protein [Nocardioides mesophilus]QNN52258.1 glutamate ABC transporter substrate-binding protein [Nocardioides mesophilus]
MRFKRTKAAFAAAGLALTLAACGGDGGGSTDVKVADNPEFDSGTTMAKLSDAGKITIGVKFDQPGIGFLAPGADAPEGFDVEMGRIIAAQLGIDDSNIEWKETVSDNREPYIKDGTVDLVLASYSITDERRQVVGQAGPYYVTGQQLLVREEDKDSITTPEDAKGKKVCSVTGSTSLQRMVDEYGADPVPFATYSECVDQLENGTVDAVTTDGAILLGYAAEDPDKLEVVGEPFSEEKYGIGFKKGDEAMCTFLQDAIKKSFDDGTWAKAFESTLGESGVETPEPPTVDSTC